MPKLVEPSVHLIAESRVDLLAVEAALDVLGVPDWDTDAESDAEYTIEFAGKMCYMSFSTELNKNLTRTGTRNNHDYIQKGIIATKHGSVIEHATMTFAILNVSRVFTHELVRHRAGTAFSQTSGRYVRTDEIAYWLPSCIADSEVARGIFRDAFSYQEECIKRLEAHFHINDMREAKDFDRKKKLTSAFRRIIGNGQANNIVFSCNHRTLRHVLEMRSSRHAEEEIRVVAAKLFELVKGHYPALYADAKVQVVDNYPEITFEASKV